MKKPRRGAAFVGSSYGAEGARALCGAIVSVTTHRPRGADYYQSLLRRFGTLSHVTVQVKQQS